MVCHTHAMKLASSVSMRNSSSLELICSQCLYCGNDCNKMQYWQTSKFQLQDSHISAVIISY